MVGLRGQLRSSGSWSDIGYTDVASISGGTSCQLYGGVDYELSES